MRHGATRALRKHGNVHISIISMFFCCFTAIMQYFSDSHVFSPKSCDFQFSGPPRSRKAIIPLGKPSLGEGCKFTGKSKIQSFLQFLMIPDGIHGKSGIYVISTNFTKNIRCRRVAETSTIPMDYHRF